MTAAAWRAQVDAGVNPPAGGAMIRDGLHPHQQAATRHWLQSSPAAILAARCSMKRAAQMESQTCSADKNPPSNPPVSARRAFAHQIGWAAPPWLTSRSPPTATHSGSPVSQSPAPAANPRFTRCLGDCGSSLAACANAAHPFEPAARIQCACHDIVRVRVRGIASYRQTRPVRRDRRLPCRAFPCGPTAGPTPARAASTRRQGVHRASCLAA